MLDSFVVRTARIDKVLLLYARQPRTAQRGLTHSRLVTSKLGTALESVMSALHILQLLQRLCSTERREPLTDNQQQWGRSPSVELRRLPLRR